MVGSSLVGSMAATVCARPSTPAIFLLPVLLLLLCLAANAVGNCCMPAALAAEAFSVAAAVLLLDSRLGFSSRCSEARAGMALLVRMCSALILSAAAEGGEAAGWAVPVMPKGRFLSCGCGNGRLPACNVAKIRGPLSGVLSVKRISFQVQRVCSCSDTTSATISLAVYNSNTRRERNQHSLAFV